MSSRGKKTISFLRVSPLFEQNCNCGHDNVLFGGADGRRYFVVGCLKLKNELSVILYTLVEVSGRLISVTEE